MSIMVGVLKIIFDGVKSFLEEQMCENKETIWQTFSNKCNNILSNNVHLAHLLVSFPEAETAATISKKVQSIRIFMAFLAACFLVID